MRIGTRTEYGIRVLITLARHHGSGPMSLAGIAKAEKLPHAYLEQLVRDLRRAGLVTSTRGQAGGYQLTRPPASITVADAMRALDGPLLEMACPGSTTMEACDRPAPCSVHEVFQRIYESLAGSLGATTLADVAVAAGGPPYPIAVRKRRAAALAAQGQGRARAPAEASGPAEAAVQPAAASAQSATATNGV
jgi:Rrf2 family transcriptional regulator, cysteine metabolism repressor